MTVPQPEPAPKPQVPDPDAELRTEATETAQVKPPGGERATDVDEGETAAGPSVVELLVRDHQKTKKALVGLDLTADHELGDYFSNLRELLVRHEFAEELVLYPALRKNVENSDGLADACIREHAKTEKILAAIEKQDTTGPWFRAQLVELRTAVLAHAKHVEVNVFPALDHGTEESELVELGARYDRAVDGAPTHPHPHIPHTAPANKLLGPMAALVDRFRDALRAA